MSNPSQWTTTYSSVFRDRRRYESPNAGASDDSHTVRAQAYYGTRAALAEHAARTAEVEARTDFGRKPDFGATGTTQFGSTNGFGASAQQQQSLNGNQTSFYASEQVLRQRDLWNTPLFPLTGAIQNGLPVYQHTTIQPLEQSYAQSGAVPQDDTKRESANLPPGYR